MARFAVRNEAAESGVRLAYDKLGSAVIQIEMTQNTTQGLEKEHASVPELTLLHKI